MEPLDIEGGFDVHAHRHGLKLLTQDADSWQLENRQPYACPSCGRAFDRLFVTEEPTVAFGSPPNSPICFARTADQLLLMTHPSDGSGGD